MSTPREALGKFIKDKLISSGALEFGEAVLQETLQDYGNNKLKFKKLDGNRLYIEFWDLIKIESFFYLYVNKISSFSSKISSQKTSRLARVNIFMGGNLGG